MVGSLSLYTPYFYFFTSKTLTARSPHYAKPIGTVNFDCDFRSWIAVNSQCDFSTTDSCLVSLLWKVGACEMWSSVLWCWKTDAWRYISGCDIRNKSGNPWQDLAEKSAISVRPRASEFKLNCNLSISCKTTLLSQSARPATENLGRGNFLFSSTIGVSITKCLGSYSIYMYIHTHIDGLKNISRTSKETQLTSQMYVLCCVCAFKINQ